MYAIVDVETTGLSPKTNRITEIAIYLHDGQKITDEFCSLINPECKIPYRITQLTGITDKMAEEAPRFCEVAKEIVELTQDCILVGHNVAFDYNFIKAEFERLFYEFKREKLCTVKLSRKLIPGQPSYSLGKLCDRLGLEHNSRHRASGDALATTLLLEHLLAYNSQPETLPLKGLQSKIAAEKIRAIPELTGVYYFYDDKGEIIYIGKSKNIHDRFLSHLNNNSTKKAIEMRDRIADISYELTGSELIALLLESHEIKAHMPVFNRAQRRTSFLWGLYLETNNQGYLCLSIQRNTGNKLPITSFTSQQTARERLFQLVEENRLCQKLCGLYKSDGACFQYGIHECNGACIGIEPPQDYNQRVAKVLEAHAYQHPSFLLIAQGRNLEEKSAVLVENGEYKGFGYFSPELIHDHIEYIKDCIKYYPDNRDTQTIIKSYMRHHQDYTLHIL